MKKRILIIGIVLIIAMTSVFAAAAAESSTGKATEINIFHFKALWGEDWLDLMKIYEQQTGVHVETDMVGGDSGYPTLLKSYIAAGEIPDIFMVHGLAEYEELKDYIEPQNGSAWEANVASFAKSAYTANDGVVMGMPVLAEYFGLLYNKDLFAQAGITEVPKTLAELAAACEKLKAIGVAPFATGWSTGWVVGQHMTNVVISKRANIQEFISGLYDGSKKLTDDAQMLSYGDTIDLILANTYANPLQEDHAASVTNFATGKAAMLTQGNWKENSIRTINPDINIGIMGIPVGNNDEHGDSIMSGLPFLLAINKQIPEERKAACRDFLNWFVTDPTAQKYIIEKFSGVPAYTNFDTTNLSPLAKQCVAYDAAGKSFAWSFSQWPTNLPQGEFAIDMQGYIGKQYASWADVVAQMQKDWENSI